MTVHRRAHQLGGLLAHPLRPLTGRYNWRTRLKSGVLGGLSPRLIEPGRMTVAALLKEQRLPHRLRRQVAPGHGLGCSSPAKR